jgi:hypothetical protein
LQHTQVAMPKVHSDALSVLAVLAVFAVHGHGLDTFAR